MQASLQYAGFWVRVGAALVDTIVILIVTMPALIAIYGSAYFALDAPIIAGTWDFLISWVLPSVAVIVFWVYRQATPGKMALSLRIVDAKSGNNPSTGQCVGRYLAYFVSMLPLCLGLIWVAVDRRKQGWHDKLAGTVVLRDRAEHPVQFDQEAQGASQRREPVLPT